MLRSSRNLGSRVVAIESLEALSWLDRRHAWECRLRQLEEESGHRVPRALPVALVERATA
jgi:hypothetical protein